MLDTVDKGYAKQRVAAIDAQITEHKESIKRLQAKRKVFTDATQIETTETTEETD